ncbi:hypothetical protein GCM10010170_025680 [Dactylosporangium salmoneum]|uniref:CGNR zinc finger domain-containing protein n=1 Tax=Dactylosporangium salmoneum TaxID=53361 RepID=A0ABN3G0W2_9ACTN
MNIPDLRHDPVGHVLASLPQNDQLIIVAASVIGCSDRAVARLVPRAAWRTPAHHYRGARLSPQAHRIPRRISAAHKRLHLKVVEVEFATEEIRASFRIGPAAYHESAYVRALCAELDIRPAEVRQCAAADCTVTWTVLPGPGRPRRFCSPACRQRQYRLRVRPRTPTSSRGQDI